METYGKRVPKTGGTGGGVPYVPVAYAGVAGNASLYREDPIPGGVGGGMGRGITNPYTSAVNTGGIWYLRPGGLLWTGAYGGPPLRYLESLV